MIKRKAHVFHTQLSLQEHLDKMGDDETLAQYTVSDGMHYIITETEVEEPRKPYVNEQLVERVSEWCTARNVEYYPSEASFMSVKDMLDNFNEWNNSNMTSQTFISVFEKVGEIANNFPEQIVEEVDGVLYHGFKGITVGGKRTKVI